MSHVLADLPEDDIRWLDRRAAEQDKSRNVLLSEIVHWYAEKLKGGQ